MHRLSVKIDRTKARAAAAERGKRSNGGEGLSKRDTRREGAPRTKNEGTDEFSAFSLILAVICRRGAPGKKCGVGIHEGERKKMRHERKKNNCGALLFLRHRSH